jgi:antitoxin CptB
MPLDTEGRRLLWRCRRGMKELDVLLEPFVGRLLASAGPVQRRALARLLELPDPELAGYLVGGQRPEDPELAALAARIRDGSACGPAAGRI